jgi:aspartate aminotransferase
MNLADWTNTLSSSPTILLNARVNNLKAKGHKIISLVVGEPDFNTPEEIKQKAYLAIENNFTKYTASEGILSLRKAICDKLKKHNNLVYSPENIVVTSGAKQAISTALLAILNPGDEVLVPVPYWVSYPEMVSIARGKPIFRSFKKI